MRNKTLLAGLIFFSFGALLFATPKVIKDRRSYPKDPNTLVSDNVFISISTCPSGTTRSLFSVSTRAASLDMIHVTSPTVGASYFSIWDARVSSGITHVGMTESTTSVDAILRADRYTGTVVQPWEFNVGFSSGIIIDFFCPNGSCPCITCINREE